MKIGQKYRFVLLTVILGYVVLLAVIAGGFHLPLQIFCLVVVAAYTMFWLVYSRRELLLPLVFFTRFAERLTGREQVPPLRWRKSRVEEMAALLKALNMLRDSQQDMEVKLRQSYAREVELKRESERQGELKSQLLVYYLDDLIAPLSMLEGAAEVLRLRGNSEDEETFGGLFLRNLARIRLMAERMREIGSLGRRDGIAQRRCEVFSCGDFMQSIFDSNRFFMNERGVKLVNAIGGHMPEKLCTDRAMLLQLLMITVRAAGRSAGAGEHIIYTCVENGREVIFTVRDRCMSKSFSPLAEHFNSGRKESLSELGLQLVAAQLQLIGGRFEAASGDGSHNIFRLSFDRSSILPPYELKNDFGGDRYGEYGTSFPHRNSGTAVSGEKYAPGGRAGAEKEGGTAGKVFLELANADQRFVFEKLLALNGVAITSDRAEAEAVLLGLPLPENPEFGKMVSAVFLVGGNVHEEQLEQLEKYDFRQFPAVTDFRTVAAAVKEYLSR